MIKYGLVCISNTLREADPDMAFKAMTRAQFLKTEREKAILLLSDRIFHNLNVTAETLKQCHKLGIKHYRISCKLFPLVTDPTLKIFFEEFPNIDRITQKLDEVGQIAKSLGISMSCHPDQFVVLGSNSDDICKKSIDELNFHAWVMDKMGLPQDYSAPINIHASLSKFESPEKFTEKFIRNFFACDIGVRNRLVLENEHHGFWSCQNLYKYFHSYMKHVYNFYFPLTLDNLHDKCNPSKNESGQIISYKDWFVKFYSTWNCVPTFHWSESDDNSFRHGKKVINNPPDYGLDCIYEMEYKDKDNAFKHLLDNSVPFL